MKDRTADALMLEARMLLLQQQQEKFEGYHAAGLMDEATAEAQSILQTAGTLLQDSANLLTEVTAESEPVEQEKEEPE